MPKKSENILYILTTLPWYYSVIAATGVYMSLAFILPAVSGNNPFMAGFASGLSRLAPVAFFLFLIPIPFSLIQAQRKRKQLDAQKDIDSIRDLHWQQFEELVGEAYRRQGYRVVENDGAGPDGGIDLVISRDGKRWLVQCKQYLARKVGVKVVREMFGLVAAEQAAGGIVITSGTFTRDAERFAAGKLLELVNGERLDQMVAGVQKSGVSFDVPDEKKAPPACPVCGGKMVSRVAKKGKYIGKQFWGCSAYPRCRGTRG